MLIVTISHSATIKDISKSLTSSNAIHHQELQKQLNRLRIQPTSVIHHCQWQGTIHFLQIQANAELLTPQYTTVTLHERAPSKSKNLILHILFSSEQVKAFNQHY